MANPGDVARVVQLNGRRLIGKTRLQKSVYFLEVLRIGFGFEFEYHHYGPYSEELAQLTDDARVLGLLKEDWNTSQDGAEYAVFSDIGAWHADEKRMDQKRRETLTLLKEYAAVELELAATAHFLGDSDRAWAETRERKASKISDNRVARAKTLLAELKDAGL